MNALQRSSYRPEEGHLEDITHQLLEKDEKKTSLASDTSKYYFGEGTLSALLHNHLDACFNFFNPSHSDATKAQQAIKELLLPEVRFAIPSMKNVTMAFSTVRDSLVETYKSATAKKTQDSSHASEKLVNTTPEVYSEKTASAFRELSEKEITDIVAHEQSERAQ